MRAWIKRGWIACLLVACVAVVANAATTGKITGVVTDKTTGEPIPGAAVTIEGTVLGALTDDEGRFVILNVPVGTHSLKASIVGYQPMILTNVGVSVDLTTYEDFELSEQAVEMDAITVTVERPLVIKDQTSSLRIMDEEAIQNAPTRGYDEIVQLQSGVVRFSDNGARGRARGDRENSVNGSLHIRGGRASEVAYYVDGFSQQDPLTGLSTTNINQNAIQEVQLTTGGFNAEYGKISSGVVNVTTKGGYAASGYNGGFEVATDNLKVDKTYDYNLYAAHLSGPVIPNNDKLSFFASGERRWQGDRAPRANMENSFPDRDRLPNNSLSGWSYQGKLYIDLTQDIQLKAGALGSRDEWSEFRMDYYFDREHTPRYKDENNSLYGQIVHNLSPKTFYTASVNYFKTSRIRGDGVHFDNIFEYARPDGQTRFDQSTLFWLGDDPATPDSFEVLNIDGFEARVPVEATVIDTVDGVIDTTVYADEGHVWDDFLKRNSSYVGFEFDITSQVHPNHEIKSGLEFQRHNLKFYQHYFPVNAYSGLAGGGFRDVNNYGYDKYANESDTLSEGNEARTPIEFAAYLQDKFEWQGLVVNAGVRLDVLDVNTRRLVNEEVPLNGTPGVGSSEVLDIDSDMEPAEATYEVSPRLGIGFPVSDQTVFHFSYGKFFQRPDLQNLYVAWDYMEYKIKEGGYYVAFGNPNLEPAKTTAYEIGLTTQLNDYSKLSVTAYYKDTEGNTEVVNQNADPVLSEGTKNFATYRNADFATVRGIDLSYSMRRIRNVQLDLNYTLAYAKGTGSDANTQRNAAWQNQEAPRQSAPLEFDQRHQFSAILDIRARDNEGPRLGDFYPFENAGVNFVFNAASGTPYTKMDVFNEITLGAVTSVPDGSVNSRYGPWIYRLDMKANRAFKIGNLNFDAYVWVLNLLDRKNALDVYESTGLPNTTGWLASPEGQKFLADSGDDVDYTGVSNREKYEIKQNDPNNYDTPRQIRFGLRTFF
ncbi:MAG: hypothetical protein Kow0074_10540 [Candidatus Zixiibacteriota bacterium]